MCVFGLNGDLEGDEQLKREFIFIFEYIEHWTFWFEYPNNEKVFSFCDNFCQI